jgi:hypothetical protein
VNLFTLDGNKLLIPDMLAGFELRVFKEQEQFIKLNLSRNSKIPSLNDCYWNPGGNEKLRNESLLSTNGKNMPYNALITF